MELNLLKDPVFEYAIGTHAIASIINILQKYPVFYSSIMVQILKVVVQIAQLYLFVYCLEYFILDLKYVNH